MRVKYDSSVDAAYVYLTNEPLTPGRDTISSEGPEEAQGEVILDWKDGRLVAIEVLGAS